MISPVLAADAATGADGRGKRGGSTEAKQTNLLTKVVLGHDTFR